MASSISSAIGPWPRLGWGWVLALGIATILLGSIALGDALAVTLISILLLGWLLIGAGVLHIIHLVRNTEARTLWHILNVILDLVVGFYFVSHPGLGAVTLTLVLRILPCERRGATDRRLPSKPSAQALAHP